MAKCKFFFTVFLLIAAVEFNVSAQYIIKAMMVDASALETLPGVTASVFNHADSVLVKVDVADLQGKFSDLILTSPGIYFVRFEMLGYEDFLMQNILVDRDTTDLGLIKLSPSTLALDEVVVKAKKPFLERKLDRLTVNVENSILSAGGTAFDVLTRSPGILIDPNEIITMRGRQGIIVYIDGRQTPMSGSDLVNYLKAMPAASVSRIDLITNPSSKYDAAGNAGIIDIRLKKDQRLGFNGAVNAGYGQGVYPKADAGIQLNYRNKKINLFGHYNYGYRLGLNHLILDRKFYDDFVFAGKDEKINYTKIPIQFHNVRLGLDYFINEKTTLGFQLTPGLSKFSPYNRNSSKVFDQNLVNTFDFNTNTDNNNKNTNGVFNVNFKRTFAKTGQEWTSDLDFGQFNNVGQSTNITRYFGIDGSTLRPNYQLNGEQDGSLNYVTFKTDYVHPIGSNMKLETGVKLSFVHSDQDAAFFEKTDAGFIPDVNKTNHFIYDENTNAAYVTLSRQFQKWDFQLGLRGEQTHYKTNQEVGNLRFDSTYLQLFPTLFAQYRWSEEKNMTFNITRRIDRPGFSQLNPFLFLIDVTTYTSGNPNLQPQFSWNFEWGYSDKYIHASLTYSKTLQSHTIVLSRLKDVFPEQSEENNVTIQIPLNLSSTDYYGLDISVPLMLNKWWSSTQNLTTFYNHFNGNLSGTLLNQGNVAVQGNTQHQFTFGQGWSAETSFTFQSGNRSGYLTFRPQWALGMGVQKKLFQNKATVRLNITDIFWSNLPRAQVAFDNYVEDWYAYRETRVATLALSYRFGNLNVAQSRRRASGSEEERRRIGNG